MQITIGSDPEFFIRNKNGNIVSAIPLIPETKETKLDFGNGFTAYHDNVTVEGTIPPAYNKNEFVGHLKQLMGYVSSRIGSDYTVAPWASHNFTPDQLLHDDAKQIGCSPFFLSHNRMEAETPTLPDGYRSAGFHVHIGRSDYKNPSDDFLMSGESKFSMINHLDYFLGLPSVIFDNSNESIGRKKIYTQSAGSHRPTPFGVEYRPLSSHCMRDTNLIELIYDLTMVAVDFVKDGNELDIDENMVVEVINTHNVDMARALIEDIYDNETIARINSFAI